MGLKVETATAPAWWACYLINGDDSGMESGEAASIDRWIESMGWGLPCSIEEEDAGFMRFHDASAFALAADCVTYVFLVDDGEALH